MPSLLDQWFSGKIPEPIASYIPDLEAAANSALKGGLETLPFYKSKHLKSAKKEDGTRVTEADVAANQTVLSLLKEHCPEDSVVSEEEKSLPNRKDSPTDRLWIVDPLDGTNDFIAQTGEFSTMVGLALGGKALLGAIFRPDPGVLYFGVAGLGAWKVENPDPKGEAKALHLTGHATRPYRFVRSRTHMDKKIEELQKKLGEIVPIPCGSVGIKCALIAEGGADLYVHPVPFLREWDTCAPEAILRGAGGMVTDVLGLPLQYGKENTRQKNGIFAARSEIWDEFRDVVRQFI